MHLFSSPSSEIGSSPLKGCEGNCGPGGKRWQPTAGFMTYVTGRLTAKNRDQLRNPTLGNRVSLWATFFKLNSNSEHVQIDGNVHIVRTGNWSSRTPSELSHWNMFKNLRDPLRCVGRSDAGPMDVNATGTLGGRRSSAEDENRGAVGGEGWVVRSGEGLCPFPENL